MACGSCSASNSPTFQQQSLAGPNIPQGSVSTMTMFWIQASFPNAPCTSPHQIVGQWRQPGVTSWAKITNTSPVRVSSGTSSASIGPFPTTHAFQIIFTTPGTYETRAARPVCGPLFVSASVSWTVLGSGKVRVLRSGASIL